MRCARAAQPVRCMPAGRRKDPLGRRKAPRRHIKGFSTQLVAHTCFYTPTQLRRPPISQGATTSRQPQGPHTSHKHSGDMAEGEAAQSLHPSGRGVSTQLARAAAQALATGEPVTAAVKTATLEQLSAIMAFACSKGGFPTMNRHLHIDELPGLGWRDLQPLRDDPDMGREALTTSLATLEYFGATETYITKYRAVFETALEGEAVRMMHDARRAGCAPDYMAYEHIKVRVPEGRRREPKILVYCWPRTVVFPDAPVFHVQPVSTPQSQYGALNVPPGSMFPRLFSRELATTNNLKLHVVGAVYSAKLGWSMAHDGREPPAHVVNAWAPLQASHLLEGPISLRRNFNPRFLTLESEYQNKLRHACAGALMMRLAVDMMPPDVSMPEEMVEQLVDSQTTGSQPQEGDLSLAQGNSMLLTEMLLDEDEIECVCEQINAEVCKWLHPRGPPCRFWNKRYGAVPDAVSKVPINSAILCEEFLVWPPEPGLEPGGPSYEPPAKRRAKLFDHAVVRTVQQAREKLAFIEQEEREAREEMAAKDLPRKGNLLLNAIAVRKCVAKKNITKLQAKEDKLVAAAAAAVVAVAGAADA